MSLSIALTTYMWRPKKWAPALDFALRQFMKWTWFDLSRTMHAWPHAQHSRQIESCSFQKLPFTRYTAGSRAGGAFLLRKVFLTSGYCAHVFEGVVSQNCAVSLLLLGRELCCCEELFNPLLGEHTVYRCHATVVPMYFFISLDMKSIHIKQSLPMTA